MSDPDFKVVETKKYHRPTVNQVGVNNRAALAYLVILATLVLSVFGLYFILQSRAVSFITSPASASLDMVNPKIAPKYGNIYFLKPGKREVRVTAPGFQPLTYQFDVTNEPDQNHVINLKKKPGFLKLKVYNDSELLSGASIYVDEKFIGLSQEPIKPIQAGQRILRVSHPLFIEHSEKIEILGEGKTQELDISMVPSFANVTISSFPEGAKISANGQMLGETPNTIKTSKRAQEEILQS